MRNNVPVLALCLLLTFPAKAQVDTNLSAGGGVIIGESTTTCDNTIEGAIRYNAASGCLDYCDGTDWMKVCGSAICPASGLVAHWKLDDGTGSTTAADSSGSGNTGTLTNMDPNTDWVAGKLGNALDFDGTDDYVAIPNLASVKGLGAYTLSLWAYITAAGLSSGNLYYESTATAGSIRLNMNLQADGTMFVKTRDLDTNPRVDLTSSVLSLNAWHHFGVTFDSVSDNTVLYVDGVQSSIDTTPRVAVSATTPANQMAIGSNTSSSSPSYFNGQIDDVRLYDRALPQADIDALYNGGAGCQ